MSVTQLLQPSIFTIGCFPCTSHLYQAEVLTSSDGVPGLLVLWASEQTYHNIRVSLTVHIYSLFERIGRFQCWSSGLQLSGLGSKLMSSWIVQTGHMAAGHLSLLGGPWPAWAFIISSTYHSQKLESPMLLRTVVFGAYASPRTNKQPTQRSPFITP